MKRKAQALLFLFMLIGFISVAQDKNDNKKKLSKEDGELLENAEFLFDESNYLRALPLYKKLNQKYPDEIYYKFKLGVCYIYKSEERENAVSLLEEVAKESDEFEDIDFHLGRAYRINYKFDDAISYFKKYLASGKVSAERKYRTEHFIEQSENAKVLIENKIEADIQNLGAPINTEYSEYVPVISADESVMIFTYRGERSKGGLQDPSFRPDPSGEYYEDIFISYRIGGGWTTPESIGDNINSNQHDASIALSADGQKLFLFKSTKKDGGDIYMSKLEGAIWSKPVKLGDNINTSYWEGSCSLSADESILYFASDRPGGQGKRDIYYSVKQADGSWGKAENMGPVINTKHNDDAPFIHPDRISLYFSSEGHNSMGGYDIFCSFKKDAGWTAPVNFGYPVSTADDDRYYVLPADGTKGYYSSGAKGGIGQQDIYTVNPGAIGIKPILALVKGTILADEVPVEAKITVTNEKGEAQGTYSSNSSTGKFLLALPPGDNYKVAFEVEGFETMVQYVNVKTLDTYVEVVKDLHMYSEQFQGEKMISSVDELQKKVEAEAERAKIEGTPEYKERKVYDDIVKKHGDVEKDSVSYTLNLGSYQNIEDFKRPEVESAHDLKKETGPDGITRVSMGPFKTLLEAEIAKARILKTDSTFKPTYITVNDKGETKNFHQYYSKEYAREKLPTDVNEEQIITSNVATVNQRQAAEKYSKILEEYGNKEIDGLSFKLEIAAVKDEADFKLQKLEEFGEIEKKKYPDGTIRYTLGPFKTLADAEAFKAKVIAKYPEAASAFVTVFHLGQRKTVEEHFDAQPCADVPFYDFNKNFDGKDLNDPVIYNDLIEKGGKFCADGLIFRVQIGAYRFPKNFKYNHLDSFGSAKVVDYPDGVTRFTMREFKTLKEAEAFRQEVIKKGTRDAWITGEYKGERKLLQELIKVNFYNRKVS